LSFRIAFTRQAREDAHAAHRWIANKLSRARADRWYQGFFRHAQTLKTFPLRCPLAAENEKFPNEIQELSYGRRPHKYRIIFEIRGDVVYVLRVRHAARDEIEP